LEGRDSCLPCQQGWWSLLGSAACTQCTFGYSLDPHIPECLHCTEGLRCTDGVAQVDNHHWPWYITTPYTMHDGTIVQRRELRVQQCSRERCQQWGPDEGDDDENQNPLSGIHICSQHRNQSSDNVLCARCEEGYSEWGPYSSCIECREANGGYIMLLIVGSFVVVYLLHSLAQSTSGMPSIFFYFVQLSIAMAPASYVSGILALFNLSSGPSGNRNI
jgi:hypothetical protein